MKQKNQEFRWPSWRRVLQIAAAVSFVGGFFAPHQWAVTAIILALLWAEKTSDVKQVTEYKGNPYIKIEDAKKLGLKTSK